MRGQAVFNGNSLLASLVRTSDDDRTERERAASVRYRWSSERVPQILSQRAEPSLDDAEHDRPGRLDADFSYGYGRTFASSEHDSAAFHTDAFGSAIRTPETDAWAQAEEYDPFGVPEEPRFAEDRPDRPDRPDGPEHEHADPPPPELPRFGYRGELALDPLVYLRARNYHTRLGRFTTPDPLAFQPSAAAMASPYCYANNDPLNRTDPLGTFSFGSLVSSVVHTVSHAVKHVVHAVTGTVTRAADVVAGTVAHAYDNVRAGLAKLDAIAHKDAAYLFHLAHEAASRVVSTVHDAVSRSVGVVESAASSTVSWIKKHNQIIGKIGSFLTNVSGYLALAGAIIAPIPGLDFLTPVLEGAALVSGIGGLAAQSLAKAAGDRNITYGDLFTAALAVIPGGGDAEDAEAGINTASHLADDAAEDAGGAADPIAARLQAHTDAAVAKFNRGDIGLTIPQERAATDEPWLRPIFEGNVIDQAVKDAAAKDPELESLYITRPGEFGPDFLDLNSLPGKPRWYDVTTRGDWAAHVRRYADFGQGTGIFYGGV